MSWIPSFKKPGGGSEYVPPEWSTGTDEEIAEALTKHYNDEIDLTEYWSIGDERVVSLPTATSGSITYDAQDVTLVLVNVGGKELVTPINGHTECAFVIGQKDCLNYLVAAGYSSKYGSNDTYGWPGNSLKNGLNNSASEMSYYQRLPESFRSLLKLHNNYTANAYNASTATKTEDYICLPSATELGYSAAVDEHTQMFTYYETVSNRNKIDVRNGSTYAIYWLSTKGTSQKTMLCKNGNSTPNVTVSVTCTTEEALAPQMVI